MDTETKSQTIEEQLQEKFLSLPKPIQDAIISADVDKQLRALSEIHKLHLDQWQKLENEVMLTLLGFQTADMLGESIKKEVGVPDEIANALAEDIAKTIFQPIREELERELDNPEVPQNVSDAAPNPPTAESNKHSMPQKLLASSSTPPAPPQFEKAVRVPASSAYTPQAPSHERESIEGDPYREPIN